MSTSHESLGPQRTNAIIDASVPSDYDGHTEFDRMTPGQRLAWLDDAVAFIESTKRHEPKRATSSPKNTSA